MGSFRPGDPRQVQDLFEQIAPRYDLLNDLLSLGQHRLWKRQAIAWLRPRPGQILLDLCCGTGDLALVMAAAVRPGGRVIGLDAAAAPLRLAAARAALQPWLPLQWLQADALATGLDAGMAHGVTMAYGLRNLADPGAGLAEVLRLLRPGGRAAVLDFNRADATKLQGRITARVQRLCLRGVVVPAATLAGLREHYAYLEASLERFPTGAALVEQALELGFRQARHRPLAGGLMGLLELQA
ncbi:menaquinone biosynthesis methyltransferase UbiE [Cyanobium sp. PCC 7001]|uniref:bifunctional demethylmenaquinone methyltransferase/2-methoxy-6-polyprenyl-1,4-benzoquinol methylase UbiE n=1 Tax=Cyanobium sp. PCC 7001 TaxID=180281 RepID=UPI0001805D39|nr:bifunctional demethylmenaquinone methyltransferase/2-methoxy-6-polyprenyl-1,4-benzoquinol methylase UbiE [Cyanobium sp. PCC 7001]EDY38188.1 menaquinone biosynthesis methyltransferase UbiE [Cyanobium sp. PCC 7001]